VIDVALLSIIRRWHLRDQVPLREIARPLGISRNTVRRYLRSENTEPSYAERRATSGLDKYSVQLSGWLKAEASKPRKQRRNLKQIHEDLKSLATRGHTTEWRHLPDSGRRVNRTGSPISRPLSIVRISPSRYSAISCII